jgi:hypothetical protein
MDLARQWFLPCRAWPGSRRRSHASAVPSPWRSRPRSRAGPGTRRRAAGRPLPWPRPGSPTIAVGSRGCAGSPSAAARGCPCASGTRYIRRWTGPRGATIVRSRRPGAEISLPEPRVGPTSRPGHRPTVSCRNFHRPRRAQDHGRSAQTIHSCCHYGALAADGRESSRWPKQTVRPLLSRSADGGAACCCRCGA